MWIVKLMVVPKMNVYRDGFFPRTFTYKKDAQQLVKEVAANGGQAVVEKAKK